MVEPEVVEVNGNGHYDAIEPTVELVQGNGIRRQMLS